MSGLIGGVGSSGLIGSTEIPGGYEEGEWTATFGLTTSGSATINTGVDTGSYTRIGRVVYIQGYFAASSVSSPVGHLKILGLPFTVATGRTDLQEYAALPVYYAGLSGSIVSIGAVPEPNSTFLYVWDLDGSTTTTFGNHMQASALVVIGGHYEMNL